MWQGSMHGRGACMAGGRCGRGNAWHGGVCDWGGACMVGWCMVGTCVAGGNACQGGHAWQGAYLLPPANEVWGKVIHMSVILFTGGGMCGRDGGVHGGRPRVCAVGGMYGRGMCGGGMHGRGHAWQGCAWWGHVWQEGMHVKGGMHGKGACVAGGCMVGGMRGRYYEIRSMSGRYASYWNAFLFDLLLRLVSSVKTTFDCDQHCCIYALVLQLKSRKLYFFGCQLVHSKLIYFGDILMLSIFLFNSVNGFVRSLMCNTD